MVRPSKIRQRGDNAALNNHPACSGALEALSVLIALDVPDLQRVSEHSLLLTKKLYFSSDHPSPSNVVCAAVLPTSLIPADQLSTTETVPHLYIVLPDTGLNVADIIVNRGLNPLVVAEESFAAQTPC